MTLLFKKTPTISASAPHSSDSDPRADFVIVFDASIKGNDRVNHSAQLAEEYQRLLSALSETGFEATGRPGAEGTSDILIFVKANEQRILATIQEERTNDWLQGLTGAASRQELSDKPIYPAERLRIVYTLLTAPNGLLPSGPTVGLTPVPAHTTFPHITSIFPPHDLEFNEKWLTSWTSMQTVISIPDDQLLELRRYYGTNIALYFSFLNYYWKALAFPSVFGVIFWLSGASFNPLYAVGIVLWGLGFVESWLIKERQLAIQWGMYEVENVEAQRCEFKPSKKIQDPVTGEERDFFPWYITLKRQLVAIPIAFAFATGLATLISFIYSVETILGEIYHGPFKQYLTLVPTILFVGVVPRVTALWQSTALSLTGWENHAKPNAYQNSLVLKVFALTFFVSYGSLMLTSYIYLPFGRVLVPYILSLLPSEKLSLQMQSEYTVNSAKLHAQIFAYTMTNQIIGAVTEVIVPFALRFISQRVSKISGRGTGRPKDEESEVKYLERIRNESTLPDYEIFGDYVELVLQFGYIVLFSLIWPIAPLWSFVNNFLELRGDAFKLTKQVKRPVPSRTSTIGPWNRVLTFLIYLAALTNSSLIYLYRPRLVSTKTEEWILRVTGANISFIDQSRSINNVQLASLAVTPEDPKAIISIRTALFTALLIALASEHVFLVARSAIRFLLNRFNWKGSREDVQIAQGRHQMRKAYLDEINLDCGKLVARSVVSDVDTNGFWRRGDWGVAEIQRLAKTE